MRLKKRKEKQERQLALAQLNESFKNLTSLKQCLTKKLLLSSGPQPGCSARSFPKCSSSTGPGLPRTDMLLKQKKTPKSRDDHEKLMVYKRAHCQKGNKTLVSKIHGLAEARSEEITTQTVTERLKTSVRTPEETINQNIFEKIDADLNRTTVENLGVDAKNATTPEKPDTFDEISTQELNVAKTNIEQPSTRSNTNEPLKACSKRTSQEKKIDSAILQAISNTFPNQQFSPIFSKNNPVSETSTEVTCSVAVL